MCGCTQRLNKQRFGLNDPQKKYKLGTVSKNILLQGLNWFYGTNLRKDIQLHFNRRFFYIYSHLIHLLSR